MDFDDIVKIVDQVKPLEARLAKAEEERSASNAQLASVLHDIRLVVAERDAARAEVERLKGQLELEENNGPYPDFSCGTFAAQRGIELKPAGGPTYTTTIKHWRGLIEERDAARAEVERLREDAAQASDAIIAMIKEERRLQDRKWGGSTYDDKHSLGDWAHLIDQRTATLYRAPEHKVAKQELIEVAALAIAALESLWRNREGK